MGRPSRRPSSRTVGRSISCTDRSRREVRRSAGIDLDNGAGFQSVELNGIHQNDPLPAGHQLHEGKTADFGLHDIHMSSPDRPRFQATPHFPDGVDSDAVIGEYGVAQADDASCS